MSKEREDQRFRVFLGSILFHTVMSTCDRFHTATGIIKNKRLVGIGYNGSLPGEPHCDDVGHYMVDGHCERTDHGEDNALFNTGLKHLSGAEAIVIGTPCIRCTRSLIRVGVKKIFYLGEYENAKGKELIDEMAKRRNVELIQFDIDYQELFQGLFNDMAKKGGVLRRAGFGFNLTKIPLPVISSDEKK